MRERYGWPEICIALLFWKKVLLFPLGQPGTFQLPGRVSAPKGAKCNILGQRPWMRVLIPLELTAPEYKLGQASVPALHASASRDKDGRLHLSIVNLDPNRPAQISTKIVGASARAHYGSRADCAGN